MEIVGLSVFVLLLYVGGFVFALIALIYFIVKRVEAKKNEDFEKRNN